MAFLRYRREVVRAWPESPRKAVYLTAVESRIFNMQQQTRMVSSATLHLASSSRSGQDVPDWNEKGLNQYKPFTSPPSTAMDAPVM